MFRLLSYDKQLVGAVVSCLLIILSFDRRL